MSPIEVQRYPDSNKNLSTIIEKGGLLWVWFGSRSPSNHTPTSCSLEFMDRHLVKQGEIWWYGLCNMRIRCETQETSLTIRKGKKEQIGFSLD